MLLKTKEDLKKYFSSIDKDYKFESLQSFIDDAEKDILIPYIGQEIYDVINTAYNGTDPVQDKKLQLLQYLQKAVVHLALMLSADSGGFRISDSGFYVVTTTTNKPVSDKKMTEFKSGRREAGYRGLEQAMIYLEKNTDEADFAAYKTSDAHQLHCAYFINESVTFTRYYNAAGNSAYLFSRMLDSIDFVERTQIAPVLGVSYLAALKTRLAAGTLTTEEKTLFPYINRALANYTIAKAVPRLPVLFDGTNLVIIGQIGKGNFDVAEDKTPANANQLSQLVADASATGQAELRNLEDYLIENAADFDGYTPPDTGEDFDINTPCSPTYFV